ncbi:MAG: hypothetical protein KAJ42_15270 [Gemmatimonadetes bacterium]|nr:hypothetical protein [Gemmatimonadota bacterium]
MKRKFTILEVMIVLAILLTVLLGAWQYARAQTAYEKVDKDSDVPIHYDWGGKDVNGEDVPVIVAEFVLRADPPANPPAPPFRILTTMAPVVGTNTHVARQLFSGTLVGQYLMTVRVQSDAGAFSMESNIVPIEVTAKKPAAPLRLRVGGQ